jgi:hypothetical protein
MIQTPNEVFDMKRTACLYALAILATSPVFAQTSSSSSAAPHFAPAPPPPGMNDPGVNPAKAPPAESTSTEPASSPAELQPSHLSGSKPIPAPRLPGASTDKDANGNSAPDVQVRKQGENTIQEYRSNGKVYMVVVTPKVGPQQIYNVDPDGRIQGQNGQPPIKPVEYTILHWGDSKPASASSAEDNGS